MEQLTIAVPTGLTEERKASLAGWLAELAKAATDPVSFLDDDPLLQAEALRRLRAGIEDVGSGRFCGSSEAKRRLSLHSERNPAG